MTARDGSASGGSAPPQRASFLRRHPVLGAFGVLAGLSLFASYFPLSAIVTAALVVVRATGVDQMALHLAHRGADAVAQRWRARHAPAPVASAPSAPSPGVHGPEAASHRARSAQLRTPEQHVSAHAEVRRQRRIRAREHAASAHEEQAQRERELSGL